MADKQYVLNGTKTYATLKRIFTAGEVYTETELGDLVNRRDEQGDDYFVEVTIVEEAVAEEAEAAAAVAPRKNIKIKKKSDKGPKITLVVPGSGDELDTDTGAADEGTDSPDDEIIV